MSGMASSSFARRAQGNAAGGTMGKTGEFGGGNKGGKTAGGVSHSLEPGFRVYGKN